MVTVENIKNGLIDKILSISYQDFLIALDKLIASSHIYDKNVALTLEQKEVLKMSELDIENGELISQKEMDERNLKWLNEL